MKDIIKEIIIIILIVAGAIFLFNKLFPQSAKYITQKINLTGFEKKQIIQDARLNWIPADSVKRLLKQNYNQAKLINWQDSLLQHQDTIIIKTKTGKDSIVYRDTSYAVQLPVYVADSTYRFFKEDSLGNSVEIVQTLLNRFFPLQEVFAPELSIDSVYIRAQIKPVPFYSDHWFWSTVVATIIAIILFIKI